MSAPLFSPSSVFWRVNRELVSGLAGPRAVLMQIAHPLVAAGVADHSEFHRHRFLRLYRTAMAAAAITFGSREFAMRALGSINRRHQDVHGVLLKPAGVFPAGTPYDANDPELGLWVLSTITESTLLVYEMFVTPLSGGEREEYYRDSLIAAKLFGIPDTIVPPTYADFRTYMNAMMTNGVVTVSDAARAIFQALFRSSFEGRLLFAGSAIGIGLLPERLKREFGFVWNERREWYLQKAAALSRCVRGHTPGVLCCNPMATWSYLQWRRGQ